MAYPANVLVREISSTPFMLWGSAEAVENEAPYTKVQYRLSGGLVRYWMLASMEN